MPERNSVRIAKPRQHVADLGEDEAFLFLV